MATDKENESAREKALERMITEAKEKPGIFELMAVYGGAEELMKMSRDYLASFTAQFTITTRANSL
jgi:hypothetical protein